MTTVTAQWIAAVRARETARSDRLFADPFAEELAGDHGFRVMAASERAVGTENTVIPVRVRWFDDAVVAGAATGLRQVVLLGAGLDTRPYRLDLPPDLDWFEVDRPDVLAAKVHAVAAARASCRRHPVASDLTGDWVAPLVAAGFTPTRPTMWLAEGLLFYLHPTAIDDLLGRAAALSAPGSEFLADVVGAAGLTAAALRPYREWCERHGTPPPFGHDDPAVLFAQAGWATEQVIAVGAPEANYGRLPTAGPGRQRGRTHLVVARPGTQ